MTGRLRLGEVLALVGLIAIIVSLAFDWFTPHFEAAPPPTGTGTSVDEPSYALRTGELSWLALGHPWRDLLFLLVLAVVAVAVTTLRAGPRRPTYGAVVTGVLAVPLALVVFLSTLLRAVVFPPDPDGPTERLATLHPAAGAWIGLAGTALALVGVWIAMADDRASRRESTWVRPEPRPVPPPRPEPPAERTTG